MKDIFSELYKKVLSFFNQDAKDEENSKDTACNRLKLVLMQDRAKMEPALMEKMREEMIEVISKYVEIDKEALDLNLEAEGDSFALMLNIPVLRAKTREEIEAAEGIDDDDDDDDILELEEDDDTEEEDVEDNDLKETEESSEEKKEEDDDINTDEITDEKSADEESSEIDYISEEDIIVETKEEIIQEEISSQIKIPEQEFSPKGSSSKKKVKHQKNNDK